MKTATTSKATDLAPLPGGFPALFETYGQALADHVAHAFPPQYRLEPPKAFLNRIRALGRAPFPAQTQAAAALATRLGRQRAAMLVGEASVGKTQIALTTAAMLGVRSVLIVAASNLLSQWQDEIKTVLPWARVYSDLTSITAVERTLAQIRGSMDLSIVLLARDQAKLGGPWRPSALEVAGPAPAFSAATTVRAPYCLGCRKVLLRVLTATYLAGDGQECRAARLVTVPVHRLAPGSLAYCPDCHRVAMDVHVTEPAPATWLACSRCRAALATVHVERKPDPNTHRVVEIPKAVDLWTASYLEAGRHRCPSCGDACWQTARTLHGRAMFSIAKYLARRHPEAFDLLLMDECFPPDTAVATPAGQVSIQDLRPGNLVLSYKNGQIVTRRVVRTIKKRFNSQLLRVTHERGVFRCTSNHRIHTARGYVPAADLTVGDTLIALETPFNAENYKNRQDMRALRNRVPYTVETSAILQQTLYDAGAMEQSRVSRPGRSVAAAQNRQATPMGPLVCSSVKSEPFDCGPKDRKTSWSPVSWHKLPHGPTNTTAAHTSHSDRMDYRVYNSNGQLLVAVRDGRSRQPTPQDRRRMRRNLASHTAPALRRPPEDENVAPAWLDRAPVLEPGNYRVAGSGLGTYLRYRHSKVLRTVSEPDTKVKYVYDLEVEDTHCYFAAGTLVSNCHDYKAGETANGMMLTDLTRASHDVLGLTATICGGKPGTMFYLLHRLLPGFRRAWPYTAATRFSREHGLAEVLSEQQTHKSADKSGKVTSRTTVKRTMRELPGISPTILRYVLDSAVFLTLRDLGVDMPPYTEEAVEIDMLPEQTREYDALVTQLAPHLKAGLRLRRLKALGTALQALLTYPDQPWRGEAVTHHKTGELVASAPALDPNVQYPKETELLRMCRWEAEEGRRVLVYVTHTDRRDIIPRLETLLRDGGLRTQVLRAETVTPRKRAQWVRGHAADVDVLVTHPKLVGTGLNIPEFHTIIWYEPEWSAYTLRQASRRTWRIGQDKPVRVYFLVYAKTAQQAALALVSRKILASLLVEGQVETDHAIATYDAGGEIFYELAKAVLDRTQISDVHETLRTLSQAQTRAQELCDTTLAAKPLLIPAPTDTRTAPRRRTISVTKPLRGEQTLLFEFA